MNKISKIKNVSAKDLKFILDDRELSEPITDLMHFEKHLTQEQAKKTLELFPKLENAIDVANYFFSHKDIRESYNDYSQYLNKIFDIMNSQKSLFEEEVSSRTTGLFDKVLSSRSFSSEYRATPEDGIHFFEHLNNQDPSPEPNKSLLQSYLKRRSENGL